MYMYHPHNHEEWEDHRDKFKAHWKEKQQAMKNHKAEADAANPPKKSSGGNLSISKMFKSELATQLMLSKQEANQLVDDVLNSKFSKDDKLK